MILFIKRKKERKEEEKKRQALSTSIGQPRLLQQNTTDQVTLLENVKFLTI